MKNVIYLISLVLLLFSCKKEDNSPSNSNASNTLDFRFDTNYIKSGNSNDYKTYYLFHKSDFKDTIYKQTITDKNYNMKVKYYSRVEDYGNGKRTMYYISARNENKTETLPIVSIEVKAYKYINTLAISFNANVFNYYTNDYQTLDNMSDSFFNTINSKYMIVVILKRYYYFKI